MEVAMDVQAPAPRPKEFSWSNTKYHLTYATHIDLAAYLNFIMDFMEVRRLEHYRMAHEQADADHPYLHTHVLLHFDKAPVWKNAGKLDFNGIHPNIMPVKSAQHWENAWEYLLKEKPEGDDIITSEPMLREQDHHHQCIQFIDSFRGPLHDLLRTTGPFAQYIVRNRTWAETLYNSRPHEKTLVDWIPRPWQAALIAELLGPSNNRTVTWVHDALGNAGKSELINYMVQNHCAATLNNVGQRADSAYIYHGEPMVLIDIPRKEGNNVDFGLVERLKNGSIISTKFHSHLKMFRSPHVVIFSNFLPDFTALSADRWNLMTINFA